MNYPTIPLAQQVIQLCLAKGIQHVVISPGSRNAPLTIGFSAHPEIATYSVVDERCAGFFALGIAQQIQEPVAVVCTSGSAMLNYYPAVAEAFYSDVPLVVISADRPKHLIDVGDGQTIRQEDVFEKHILYSANLKQDLEENDDRHRNKNAIPEFVMDKLKDLGGLRVDENQEAINHAINTAIVDKGPVHINVPFAEPLYKTQEHFSEEIKVIEPRDVVEDTSDPVIQDFVEHWNKASKKMVLIGVNQPNTIEQGYLDLLANDPSVVVFTESTSNLHHANFFPSIDKIIAPLDEEGFKQLQPEVLLTFGGMVVSKKIKAFLRTYTPVKHYHVDSKKAFDTYFCLSQHFKVKPNTFFRRFEMLTSTVNSDYRDYWLAIKAQRSAAHKKYLAQVSFTDLKAFEKLIHNMPDDVILHLSNSSTIRYFQLFNDNPTVLQYCNRGTSGIDGSTSTAVGHSVVSNKQNVLITGDLSFFYDSNALWNNYIPKSFRIIVINNSGGGIFRILPGNKNTEAFDTYFETKHELNAMHLCDMYQFEYTAVDNEETLHTALETFYEHSARPRLLEIFTPRTINDSVLIDYFKSFND